MDLASLATLLLMALALAAQPWSVLAGILLVATRGGVVKEIAYVVGWIAALSAVMAITVAMAPETPSTSGSTATAAVEIALGLLLAGFLAVRWRRADGDDGPHTLLDGSPGRDALDPRAGPRGLPAELLHRRRRRHGDAPGRPDGDVPGRVVGVVFVLLASLGVAAPLGVLVARRDRAPEVYAGWRTWIMTHSRTVTYGMGAVVAGVLVVKGLWSLAT